MIKQVFDIEDYWKVIVYYDIDFRYFSSIVKDLVAADSSNELIIEAYHMLKSGEAKAATFSNIHMHISIVLFNIHNSKEDYLNSIVHEAEHVKQAMLKAYNVEDKGESPAYTIGHILSRMYPIIKDIICYKCNEYG